jgi:hypothetical protein
MIAELQGVFPAMLQSNVVESAGELARTTATAPQP